MSIDCPRQQHRDRLAQYHAGVLEPEAALDVERNLTQEDRDYLQQLDHVTSLLHEYKGIRYQPPDGLYRAILESLPSIGNSGGKEDSGQIIPLFRSTSKKKHSDKHTHSRFYTYVISVAATAAAILAAVVFFDLRKGAVSPAENASEIHGNDLPSFGGPYSAAQKDTLEFRKAALRCLTTLKFPDVSLNNVHVTPPHEGKPVTIYLNQGSQILLVTVPAQCLISPNPAMQYSTHTVNR